MSCTGINSLYKVAMATVGFVDYSTWVKSNAQLEIEGVD